MNKITYKKINLNKKDDTFLYEYIKVQKITQVISVKTNNILYVAYDQKQIVGFSIMDTNVILDTYITLSYLHVSKEYHSQNIGEFLFNIMALEAKKIGVKKIYISPMVSFETDKLSRESYDLKQLDTHLEYQLNYLNEVKNLIYLDLKTQGIVTAQTIGKTASRVYRFVPKNENEFLNIFEELIRIKKRGFFSVGTLMVKRNKTVYRVENMNYFDRLLKEYVCEWYEVDQYCTRILSPMIALKDSHYEYLLSWSDSHNKDIRRASLVSMIKPLHHNLVVDYDFDRMIYLVEKLKNDEDIHVKKAVGWVLKCSYLVYPIKIEKYLRDNSNNLERLIFRYALEHIKNPLRQELIKL